MLLIRLLTLSLMLLLTACNSEQQTEATSKQTDETATVTSFDKNDEMSKIAYAMGANSGHFLAQNLPEFAKWGMEVDPELIKKGFLDALDQKSAMDEKEFQAVLMAFQEQIRAKLTEIEAEQAKVSTEANKLFLDANALKEGVKVTESGIHYKIIEPGTGANPVATDSVLAHYRGTLVNGEEFDSSYARNKPTQFALNGVIPGWTEGLQLIKEGGKIQLILPPEMAYGNRALSQIPANSILIFEIELVKIIKPETEAATDK